MNSNGNGGSNTNSSNNSNNEATNNDANILNRIKWLKENVSFVKNHSAVYLKQLLTFVQLVENVIVKPVVTRKDLF